MLTDLESDLVERKESLSGGAPNRFRKAVCAFANDAIPVPTASIDDLSLRRFEEEYLPLAVDAATLSQNDRSVEQRLAAMKMIGSDDNPTPTIAGLIVLGKRPRDFLPGAYVQFLRIAGADLNDPVIDEALCDGPLMGMVGRLEGKLDAHNRTAVDFTSGPREVRTSTYPPAALQQLTLNAIMHRTYEGTNSPVHVYWFDDRIEINSPGGPYGAVSRANFGRPGLVDYRNPSLAESMRVLGLVQRYGAGIPSAKRLLRDNGQPEPQFRVDENWVHCTVRART